MSNFPSVCVSVALVSPLEVIVSTETGQQCQRDEVAHEIINVVSLIDQWLQDEGAAPDEAAAGVHVSDDDRTQRAVDRFFEANESFRGVASQEQPAVAKVFGALIALEPDGPQSDH